MSEVAISFTMLKCYLRHLDGIPKKWPVSRQLPFKNKKKFSRFSQYTGNYQGKSRRVPRTITLLKVHLLWVRLIKHTRSFNSFQSNVFFLKRNQNKFEIFENELIFHEIMYVKNYAHLIGWERVHSHIARVRSYNTRANYKYRAHT